ncbi:MAG: PIN domain nuclease [Candidatus Lokiarchaeota archaeon]|nr:PIN domain nuclease [Candidatus Lokiarchaeota archaeon]
MPILESDLIIAYFRNIPKAIKMIDKLIQDQSILRTTIFNVAELYKGAYLSLKTDEYVRQITNFLENNTIIPFTLEDAITYRNISAKLRNKGKSIGDFDELIASIAINNDETIYH